MNTLYVNFCAWLTRAEFDTDNKVILFGVNIIDKILFYSEKIVDKFNR